VRKAVWLLRAQLEQQRLYERLEDVADGLGDRFHAETIAVVELIEQFPGLCRPIHPVGLRKALVFNHRFGVLYRIEPRGLMIHSILDLHEDPERIQREIEEIVSDLKQIDS
jgi:hypothetical protein